MTNAKDFFSGNFIKAEDCKGGEIVEIMSEGEVSEIRSPEGKLKPIMNYQVRIDGVEKDWTPNMTNGHILVEAWGGDDKLWIGKKFQIKLVDTIVFGKKKKSIIAEPMEEKPKLKI